MNNSSHNKKTSFIWSIADDCLRYIYEICASILNAKSEYKYDLVIYFQKMEEV